MNRQVVFLSDGGNTARDLQVKTSHLGMILVERSLRSKLYCNGI